MFVYKDNGPAIAIIPKNASLSIRQMLPNVAALSPDEAKARGGEIVVFARDPLDRLVSAYQFFSDLRKSGGEYKPNELPDFKDWPSFVDMTFVTEDSHWAPQVSFLKDAQGKVVTTRVHRLEDLSKVWPRYYDTEIVFSHVSHNWGVDYTYRRDELLAKYAEDLALYSEASS